MRDEEMKLALEAKIHNAGMNPIMQGGCYLMHPEAMQKVIDAAIREALAEQPAPMSESNRVIAYAASSKLQGLGYRWQDGEWVQPAQQEPVAWLDGPHLVMRSDWRDRANYKGPWVDFGRAIPDSWVPVLYTSPPPQPERVRELECVIADLKAECQAIRAKQPTAEESSVVQPAPVPEGWKLVPVEPTDEMLDAAQFVVTDIYRVDVDRVYATMLRNAPEKGQP